MSTAEVISLICAYCNYDTYIMEHSLYEIEVHDDYIVLHFRDGNTGDVTIYRSSYLV